MKDIENKKRNKKKEKKKEKFEVTDSIAEFEINVFDNYFLEYSKNFLNFTKFSKKCQFF